MRRKKQKIIQVFNNDIKSDGRYKYTDSANYSAAIATKRQTDEIINLLKYIKISDSAILDVGCGDGTFTLEIFKAIKPKKIVGFDRAQSAIRVARSAIKIADKKKIFFKTGNIYNAHKMFKKNSFDVIVVRGVMHHLDNPQQAIKSLRFLSNKVIILEPNGFNPILKIIEKLSPYHRQHQEKSYYPPTLNSWFEQNSFMVKKQIFFSIVPYFFPEIIARTLKSLEPFIESLPLIKLILCGTNLIYFERKIS